MRRRAAAWAARPGQRPQPSLPAGTDLLPQIKHIVVLMMENHSYDNYLGMLRGRGEGFPLGADGQPAVRTRRRRQARPRPPPASTAAAAGAVPELACEPPAVGRREDATGSSPAPRRCVPDADPAVGMGYWTEADLPFYYGLARTFPLADHWFSSCLGPDVPQPPVPHRRNGARPHRRPAVRPARLPARRDHLRHADQARHLLGQLPPGAAATSPWSRRYAHHRRRMARRRLLPARPAFRSVTEGVQKDLQFTADVFPLGIARYMLHVRGTDAVLRRRRQRHAARVQHRGPRLRRLLRGEPAGHPEGRELRRRGDQPGHARQGVAPHAADLGV